MMRQRRLPTRSRIAAAALAALMVLSSAPLGWAASHRVDALADALEGMGDDREIRKFEPLVLDA